MRQTLPALVLTGFLAACAAPQPPSTPPGLTAAPPVATDGFLSAYAEETVPVSVSAVRRALDATPIIGFLEPTENLSNPVASEVLSGTWPDPGAVRWLRLADGHYVVERVLENEPRLFRYQVYVFTNAAGRGVEQIVGEQRFVPVDSGTRIEWSYNVRPRNALTRQAVRGSMDEIEGYIQGGLTRFAESLR